VPEIEGTIVDDIVGAGELDVSGNVAVVDDGWITEHCAIR
jgi:hypothetical protein